jgi:hypothetical protein
MYSLEIRNMSHDPIEGFRIQYGPTLVESGSVRPFSVVGYETVFLPIPKSAAISWEHQSGKSFQKTVEIEKLVEAPKRFDGYIILRLDDTGNATVDVRDEPAPLDRPK